jgi:PEP-CTERM motif
MKKFSIALLAVAATTFALLGTARASTIIYLAPEDATNQIGFSGNSLGAYGVGNTITFAGSGTFSLATVDLFGYAGGGSKPIEVDLYAGTNPNTGALLGSAQVTPTGNGYTTEVFDFGGLEVPQTLTFIVSIVGNGGGYDDSFVNWQQFTGTTGSPTIGTSGDMWYGTPGGYILDNGYAVDTGAKTNTLAAQFNATPEPSSLLLLGTGLLGLAFIAFRKAKSSGLVSHS